MKYGYKEKLMKVQVIEREIEKTNQEFVQLCREYGEAVRVVRWLEEHKINVNIEVQEFVIKTNGAIEKYNKKIKEKCDLVRKLEEELGPYKNLRHVIFSLANEMNIELNKLPEELNCTPDDMNMLWNYADLDKDTYFKLCNYFGLNIESYEWYCSQIKK